MSRILPIISIFLLLLATSCQEKSEVNPFIGTGGHGHTFPGATTPFGLVQLSPDTRAYNWDASAGYHYTDSTMVGFSHTHLSGTGCSDLGDILIRPTTLTLSELTDSDGNIVPAQFSHSREEAYPGYYSVVLDESGSSIKCEVTATSHIGVHRYSFEQGVEPAVVLDLNHELEEETIDSMAIVSIEGGVVTGYKVSTGWTPGQKVFFAAHFSETIESVNGLPVGDIPLPVSSDSIRMFIQFKGDFSTIEAEVALSLNSIEGAIANLNAESNSNGFEGYLAEAKLEWSKRLSPIVIKGGGSDDREIFYTALYHCYMAPNLISDCSESVERYSTLSLWDTYRTWHPLMTIIEPEKVNTFIGSMLEFYKEKRELPIWPLFSEETGTMIGYHSVSVISDAWNKGIRDFDPELALEAMVVSSNVDRKGNPLFRSLGYIPSDIKKESVSCALEYSYDDWTIAEFANSIGNKSVAKEYYSSSQNYRNLFDGNSGFFRGKRSDGNWNSPFNPVEVSRDMTEATPWQYRFSVPHDVNGLIYMMGGADQFKSALDSLFLASTVVGDLVDITGLKGQYAHGNEPSHHIAYLYNFIGMGWRTQELISELRESMYSSRPDGIIGNEDCGQMSAWYIMSSLGFYPLLPGSDQYILTTPLFKESEINMPNGNSLSIVCDSDPKESIYIKEVYLNGNLLNRRYITHREVIDGGELKFILSKEPDYEEKGIELPYSYSSDRKVSTPYVTEDLYLFNDNCMVSMGVTTPEATIYYTTDGTTPTESSEVYSTPVEISEDCTLKLIAYRDNFTPSDILSINAEKALYREGSSVKEALLKKGVNYRYFEGDFHKTADLKSATPKSSGDSDNITLDIAEIEDHFGAIFTGYLKIEATDIYQFSTVSDDGSILLIDGEKVVDNDGSHAAVKAIGKIALSRGYHKFELLYFEDYEGHSLEATVKIRGGVEVSLDSISYRY